LTIVLTGALLGFGLDVVAPLPVRLLLEETLNALRQYTWPKKTQICDGRHSGVGRLRLYLIAPSQTNGACVMTTAIKTVTTDNIDRELDKAKRDELLDSELDTVTGGSFDLGNIVGSIAKAVVPMAL
jgi:hypothetical protein